MGDPEAAFPGSLVLARCYGTTHAVGKAGVWCGVWVGTAAFGQHGTTRTYPTPAVPLPQIRRMAETAGDVLPWLRVPVRVAGWGPMSRDISIQGFGATNMTCHYKSIRARRVTNIKKKKTV